MGIGLCACLPGIHAAEVRGAVNVDYQGLFEVDASVTDHPVSVALLPGQGQRVIKRPNQGHRLEVRGNRMHPSFMTVQKGDRIRFVNRDKVFHEIFSLSPGEPLKVRLAKAGSDDKSTMVTLNQSGTTHFFCRIHNKSYARIDVVETPYLQTIGNPSAKMRRRQTIEPGKRFHFVGLAPGKWKLRLASPAAETRWIPVTAVTSPPALDLTLTSRGGGAGIGSLKAQVSIDELYGEQAR